jgi:hypothetical protein
MRGRLKAPVLVAVVAAAALVPLFGDPRQTPVTHPLWARMLLRSLEMTDAIRASSQASQVFSALAPRDSLDYSADRYWKAEGASLHGEGASAMLVAGASPAEVSFAIPVALPGDYHLRARLASVGAAPCTAEIVPFGGGEPFKSFTLNPAAVTSWVTAGTAHLDPGAYRAEFLLPPGASLSQVELAPPCVDRIEPVGGWRPDEVTTAEDVAVTSLKAIDVESELPPAATPIELAGDSFQVDAPPAAVEARATVGGFAAMTLRAGRGGLRAIASFEVPEAGLYSLFALTLPGSGERYLVDGCRKVVVCPSPTGGWRPILSQSLAAGRHTLVLTLGEGASFDRLRLERKKGAPADYVATLKRLGFDPGPPGEITRSRALDAMRFVRDQRRMRAASLCGDRLQIEESLPTLPAQVAEGGTTGEGNGPGRPGPGGGVEPPVVQPPQQPPLPPLLPPQPPSSPTHP